jgi:hypothetical protein
MKNDKERILPLVITSQYYSPPSRARPLKEISWSCSPADQRYHREKGVFYPPSFGNRVSGRACRSAGTWGTCGFVFHSQFCWHMRHLWFCFSFAGIHNTTLPDIPGWIDRQFINMEGAMSYHLYLEVSLLGGPSLWINVKLIEIVHNVAS